MNRRVFAEFSAIVVRPKKDSNENFSIPFVQGIRLIGLTHRRVDR